METSLSRARGFVVSAQAFRRLALTNAAVLIGVVATGATVRLTESGLGCLHWPGCQPGDVLPDKGFHSDIEFSNRVVAGVTITVTLLTFAASFFTPGLRSAARRLAGVTFVGALAQAPLGALTVYYHLNPWFVISHLLLSLVVIGIGVLVVFEAFHVPAVELSKRLRALAVLVGTACIVLVVTGTFVTASGPYPGSFNGTPVERLGSFHPAIWIHVRATAIFGISLALLLIYLVKERHPRLIFAWPVLAVLAVQMTVGEVQYRTGFPWWLILIHVTLAATLWAATVALVAALLRPSRMR
jgi:cytochrome c oxidase assembly protein subunit 15